MTKLQIQRHAEPQVKPLYCPECHSNISNRHGDAADGKICLCPACAAIIRKDGIIFRLLKTDEWWPIRAKPEWFQLCVDRVDLLDRLTSPG